MMKRRSENAKAAILKVLDGASKPMGASQIAKGLESLGLSLRPRTIRLYLLQLDKQNYTRLVSKREGRVITEWGREEHAHTNVMEKVGMVSARLDSLGYRMNFRNTDGKGTIIMNVCMIKPDDFPKALEEMKPVFDNHLGMGRKLIVVREGGTLGASKVPKGFLGLGTICSVTLNGILLHLGIPVVSRFGGLLEMRDWAPVRFVEAIEYRGSTLDPIEVFIRADMTRVRNVVRNGSGVICASFREVPSVAIEDIRRAERAIQSHGLGGILALGKPNQPFLGVPVSEGYSGMVVIGGLNPIAAAHEAGVPITIRSLAGLQEFESLQNVDELVLEDI